MLCGTASGQPNLFSNDVVTKDRDRVVEQSSVKGKEAVAKAGIFRGDDVPAEIMLTSCFLLFKPKAGGLGDGNQESNQATKEDCSRHLLVSCAFDSQLSGVH